MWIVISILGGGIVTALLLFFFLVIKNHNKKKVSKNTNTNESTPPQTAPSQDSKFDVLKKRVTKVTGTECFFPLLLALGVVCAVWFMADGLPWWSFFVTNKSGAWVLLVALIVATIVYKKKAVPVLGILLLISLAFYFGPKMTAAREGPKSAAQVGFFDGTLPLKAGQWSETIFIKNGFELYCPPGIIYSVTINGIKEIKWDGKSLLLPPSEGLIKSLRIKSPVDTMMTFTQLTK